MMVTTAETKLKANKEAVGEPLLASDAWICFLASSGYSALSCCRRLADLLGQGSSQQPSFSVIGVDPSGADNLGVVRKLFNLFTR